MTRNNGILKSNAVSRKGSKIFGMEVNVDQNLISENDAVDALNNAYDFLESLLTDKKLYYYSDEHGEFLKIEIIVDLIKIMLDQMAVVHTYYVQPIFQDGVRPEFHSSISSRGLKSNFKDRGNKIKSWKRGVILADINRITIFLTGLLGEVFSQKNLDAYKRQIIKKNKSDTGKKT